MHPLLNFGASLEGMADPFRLPAGRLLLPVSDETKTKLQAFR
jgi:hypothetical protein